MTNGIPVEYSAGSSKFALALAAEPPNIVESVIVHEVAIPLGGGPPDGPFARLFSPDDETVVETCKFLFRNVANEDQKAWHELGADYHRRQEKNYLTWARRYVGASQASGFFRVFTAQDLTRRPITWTVGVPAAALRCSRAIAESPTSAGSSSSSFRASTSPRSAFPTDSRSTFAQA
jgi:hypothetical protein